MNLIDTPAALAIRRRELRTSGANWQVAPDGFKPATKPFDIFISVKRVDLRPLSPQCEALLSMI